MKDSLKQLWTHAGNLYLGNRFFVVLGGAIVFSVIGFWYGPVFWAAVTLMGLLAVAVIYDVARLFFVSARVGAVRSPPKLLGLNDTLEVSILVENNSETPVHVTITDEAPAQLQLRGQKIGLGLAAGERKKTAYLVAPKTRGEYRFGNLNLFIKTNWKLAERRKVIAQEQSVAVYPSVLQMKSFALHANSTVLSTGRRRLRKLTKSYEFDQIKEYVRGDDYRGINWKATGRRAELMVNQYEEERAQRVYCVIDKGRTMLMPFAGLSLLDYAINASLALSNVILKREDRAGLITFSDKLGDVLTADDKPGQLQRILETLYRQRERAGESDYDLLYYASRRFLGGRSLLILFTNFESNYALDRVLPVLRRMARGHRIVVVLFENTEVADLLTDQTESVEDVYLKNTARRYLQERQLMAARLRRNGIGVVLTRPEELSGAVISQYLEMKARGLI